MKLLSIFIVGLALCCCVQLTACGSQTETTETTNAGKASGEALFQAKCSMCHDFKEVKIGPPLAGVWHRWGNGEARLRTFIKDAKAAREHGDARALEVYEAFNKSEMPSFAYLSDEEIAAVTAYLK